MLTEETRPILQQDPGDESDLEQGVEAGQR